MISNKTFKKVLVFLFAFMAWSSCDSREPQKLLCAGADTPIRWGVFDFETDQRTNCEVHNETLTRVRIPVSDSEFYACILADAPHGRLIAFAPTWLQPKSGFVEINRCPTCTRLTEKYFGMTRQQLEEHVLKERAELNRLLSQ
jgi:hypothetical protein